jgi:CheY-like chemotaxis protein
MKEQSGKKQILVAEDNDDTLTLLQLILQHAGFDDVLVARDGKTALDMARSQHPALVITDLMMPELHGIHVCHQIKSDPQTQDIKVMIVSVKNYPADHEQAAEAGADSFMGKPVNEKAFIAEIRKLLG